MRRHADGSEWLTIAEAQAFLGVSQERLRQLRVRGVLKTWDDDSYADKSAPFRYYSKADLQAYKQSRKPGRPRKKGKVLVPPTPEQRIEALEQRLMNLENEFAQVVRANNRMKLQLSLIELSVKSRQV